MCQVETGAVVRSAAGRDKDRFFVVMKIEGAFAWICDGKMRPLGRQKRKKIMHLRPTHERVDLTTLTTDKRVRETLRPFQSPVGEDPKPER